MHNISLFILFFLYCCLPLSQTLAEIDGVFKPQQWNNATTNLSIELLSTKEIFVKGNGFINSSMCYFTSTTTSNVSFGFPLLNFNASLGSCQVPSVPDNYSLSLINGSQSNILISVNLSQLGLVINSQQICEGDTLDFSFSTTLINNWQYTQDGKSLAYNQAIGCRSNNDCPYDNYCYNCSLCAGNDCPGCPSPTGGSCYALKSCFLRNDSIEGCGVIEDPCSCASEKYPFTDSVYLESQYLGCLNSNQCYIQDSKKCLLPSFPFNNQTQRECLPQLDNEFTAYCEWTDGFSNVTTNNLEIFTQFVGQNYDASSDYGINFLNISNQNINFNTCYQKCIQTKDCSGLEYPDNGSYCGLWLNKKLISDALFWKAGFQGKTLTLKQSENATILLPAIYKNNQTLSCPIPSRYSIKANVLKVRILEENNGQTGFNALTFYHQGFLWSYCSKCSDLFADNFDLESNYMIGNVETCTYQNSNLTTVKTVDGTPQYQFSTRSNISRGQSQLDFFSKYEGNECKGIANLDYFNISTSDMNEDYCASNCSSRSSCSAFETSVLDSTVCYLWVNPQICNLNKMDSNANFNIFFPGNNIKWTDLAKTNDSIYGYYLYIHQLRFTQMSSNSSLALYLRETSTNLTFSLFDSSIYGRSGAYNLSEITFHRMKIISGDFYSNVMDFLEGNTTNSTVFHAANIFLPIFKSGGQQRTFQLGVQVNLNTKDVFDLSGITFVITDWARLNSNVPSLFPSRFVANCSFINGTASKRFNTTVPRSEILLKKLPNETFPSLQQGGLFTTLGCYKLNTTMMDHTTMPVFIENITAIDQNSVQISVLHEVLLSDIFSFAKIDTTRSQVLTLSEALNMYEVSPQNSSNIINSKLKWYFEPNITNSDSAGNNSNYFSYKQGNLVTPHLNLFINDSTVIKGTFAVDFQLFGKMAAGFDTRTSIPSSDRRLQSEGPITLTASSNDLQEQMRLFYFDIPIGGSILSKAYASVTYINWNWVDQNVIDSRGSISTTAKFIYNIPKGLVTKEIGKVVMDILPAEVGHPQDLTLNYKLFQGASLNFNFIGMTMLNEITETAEIDLASDYCGGSTEASQTAGQNIFFGAKTPSNSSFSEETNDCSRVLGRVCTGPLQTQKLSRRRDLSQANTKSTSEPKVEMKLGATKNNGTCKIENSLSAFLQFLDCNKTHSTSYEFDTELPDRAIQKWPSNKGGLLEFNACFDCQFIVPPGNFNIKRIDYDYNQGSWGTISPAPGGYEFYNDEDDIDISSTSAFVFGEPHVFSFSEQSVFPNEVGDFYLFRLKSPLFSSEDCLNRGYYNREQYSFAKELESYNEISQDFIGAQIRFLPGFWAQEMTVTMAMTIKVGDEQVEIRQLLNRPSYDARILVNGIEYDQTTPLTRMKIQNFSTIDSFTTYMVSSKYFKIKWSSFGISVSLSKFVTNTISSDLCAVRSDGLLGDWLTKSLSYRFSGGSVPTSLNQSATKVFVDSWRVLPNETVISNWLPIYSDNNTKSYYHRIAQTEEEIEAAYEANQECESLTETFLYELQSSAYCWNEKLAKFDTSLDNFLTHGCAYDYWIARPVLLEDYYIFINNIKLQMPINCVSPLLVLAQSQITTIQPTVDLKIFEQSVPSGFIQTFPNITTLTMQSYLNDTASHVNYTIYNWNGSIQLNFMKKGNYQISIRGMFINEEDMDIDLFENYGYGYARPGVNGIDLIVSYQGPETNNGSNFGGRINSGLLMILLACLMVLAMF